MTERHLEARMSVVESKVEDLEQEEARTRQRLHELESERQMVRLVNQQMRELATRVEEVATRAAEKAVDLAFEKRDEQELEVKKTNAEIRAALLGGAAAIGALIGTAASIAGHYLP